MAIQPLHTSRLGQTLESTLDRRSASVRSAIAEEAGFKRVFSEANSTRGAAGGAAIASAPAAAPAALPAPISEVKQFVEPIPVSGDWWLQLSSLMANPPADLEQQSISALKGAMREAGLPVDSIQFDYREEFAWHPGGGYMNRQLRATNASGESMDLSAVLTLWSPRVAAAEIRDYLMAGKTA
jgi:hypothetical protein